MPLELPTAWAMLPLGNLGDWYGGGTPRKSNSAFWDGDIPWVSPKDVKVARLFDTADHISAGAIMASATRLIGKRSILVVTRSGILANTLPVSINEVPMAINQDLKAITPFEGIDAEYLAWALRTFQRQILNQCSKHGTTVHSIELPRLRNFEIPVAPRCEQRRIVAKIEELFSELDKGIESLKTARAQLKVYRQAVLKHAFEGKLTAQWREENKDKLETAEQFFTRIKYERAARYERQLDDWTAAVNEWEERGKPGKKPRRPKKPQKLAEISNQVSPKLPLLPECWRWVRLGDISDVSGGLTKNQKRNSLARKMKYLRVANVYADKILTDDVRKIGVTDAEARTVTLEAGDLLIVEGNGSINQIGRVAIWDRELSDCGHQNHLIKTRLLNGFLPRFFLQFLLSPVGRDLIVKQASSTSGLHTLSISKVSNLIVPVTSSAEESAVVAQIAKRLSNVEKALDEIDTQLKRSNMLRQSILKKAFSGELVNQDPSDEPAAILLERIKAEKAPQAPKTKARKRKVASA